MRNSLFDDSLSNHFLPIYFLAVNSLDYLKGALVLRHGLCMHRSLLRRQHHVREEGMETITCGTSPFGSGMSMMPAIKLVQPKRKKSQWKPPGFLSGKCLACAVTLL